MLKDHFGREKRFRSGDASSLGAKGFDSVFIDANHDLFKEHREKI
jgi:lysine/ornithine N-monooxygenase